MLKLHNQRFIILRIVLSFEAGICMICNFTNSSTGRDKNVFQAIKLATNLDRTVLKENREAHRSDVEFN